MIADCILDTSAVVAFLRLEPGAEHVRERLNASRCLMHAVNVAEICFTVPRRMPERFTPELAMAWFIAANIAVSDILAPDFLQMTAKIRLAERSLSIGDGMAIALASVLKLPVLTTERNFKKAHQYTAIELIR